MSTKTSNTRLIRKVMKSHNKVAKMNAGDSLGECQSCGGLQDCDLNWCDTTEQWLCDECHSDSTDTESEGESAGKALARRAFVQDYRQRVNDWKERNKAALERFYAAEESARKSRVAMIDLGMPKAEVWKMYAPPRQSDFVKEPYPEAM